MEDNFIIFTLYIVEMARISVEVSLSRLNKYLLNETFQLNIVGTTISVPSVGNENSHSYYNQNYMIAANILTKCLP